MAANIILPKRHFGGGGPLVSVLGLGTVKFGRNQGVKYPGGDGFELPSDAVLNEILALCQDYGLNFVDTAPAYGLAEERLGRLLAGRRDGFFLCSKTGEEFADGQSAYDFTAPHTTQSIERSLRRLRTDYLDAVFVHSNHDDVAVITQTPVLQTLQALKQQGKIRHIGVSVYTEAGGMLAVQQSDAVMVTHNPKDNVLRPVIDYAQAMGKAVVIKKPLASGHLAGQSSADCLRFSLRLVGATTAVIGSIRPDHIRQNILAVADSTA
jgi:aryl-alcohol dehydrogenase-like predicted oxidoreductase